MTLRRTFLVLIASVPLILPVGAGPLQGAGLSRDQAVRMALENNPDLQAAHREREAARGRRLQARAPADPEFEIEYEGLSGGLSPGGYEERNIGVKQRLELPHRWWLRNRIASEEAEAARHLSWERTLLELTARVKIAYDRVLCEKLALDGVEQNHAMAVELLEKTRLRYAAGDVARLEVVRTEVEEGRARALVAESRSALRSAGAGLNVLLGLEPDAPVLLEDDLEYVPFDPDTGGLRELALQRSPELLGARRILVADRARLDLARISALPDLHLGLYRQRVRAVRGSEDFWRWSVGLDLPVWAAFRQRGEIVEARAELERRDYQIEALRLDALLELDRALLEMENAREQALLYRDNVLPLAEQAYRAASRSYDEGKAAWIDILEARSVLTQTRIEYARKLFDYRSSLARLEMASGGEIE